MSNVIILTSGTSYASQALSVGVGIPLKYVLPMYDYRYDPYVLSANIVPSSACEPVSAVSFFGEPLYNITNLPAYTYTMTNSKMILSAAGQSGTTTLTGNPFNNNSYMNLLNGKPISPLVSGSSMVYNGGTWSIAGYASVPVSGTLSSVSGYTYIKEIYHDVISYAPIVSSDGTGVGRGVYRVRLNNQIGQFKFNKLILYMAKYVNGVEDDTVDPVPAMVVSLDRPVIKSTNGSNVNYFEADIEVAVSASNYFSQVSYLNNSVFNQAGPGLVNYTGKVAIGSSAIPGSWEPRARLHLYSETGIEHLRMSNENFNYINFTMGEQSSSRISMILDTSASKDVLLGVRGVVSASNNMFAGGGINVSGDFFNPRVSIQADGVISTDSVIYTEYLEVYNVATFDNDIFAGGNVNVSGDFFNPRVSIQADGVISTDGVIYTEYLEVYNTASFNNETTHNNNAKFYEGATLSTIITSGGTISAGGTDGAIYSRSIASNSLEVTNNATFDRNTFHLDKMEFYNPLGERTIVITSAGVVSANSNLIGNGLSVALNGYFGGQLNVGYSLQVNEDATFLQNVGVSNELSVGGTTTLNDLNVSGTTNLCEDLNFTSASGFIHSPIIRVSADNYLTNNFSADCGNYYCGKVIVSPGSANADCYITVKTSRAKANSIIFLTPILSTALFVFSPYVVIEGSTVEGVSFYVYKPKDIDYSDYTYGFNFMIINPSP